MSPLQKACVMLLTLFVHASSDPKAIYKQFSPEDAKNMSMVEAGDRIYARIEDMPFIARLTISYKRYRSRCGGALIKSQKVLTAAHCVSTRIGRMQMIEVCMGETYLPDGYKCHYSRLVEMIILPEVEGIDIAILHLSQPFPHIPNRIESRELYRIDQDDLPVTCMVMGWGKMHPSISSANLLTTNVDRIAIGCPNRYICVYSSTNAPCKGDSGGPLVCNNKIVGVASVGTNGDCNQMNGLTIYASISNNFNFIMRAIGNCASGQWDPGVALLKMIAIAALTGVRL